MHLYGSAKMMDEHSRISIQPHSMKNKKENVFFFDDDIKDCKINEGKIPSTIMHIWNQNYMNVKLCNFGYSSIIF